LYWQSADLLAIFKNKVHASTNNLIVGAGLAGCTLARKLEQAGQGVQLVGSSAMPSAAHAAAGIINPVTGRWMTKSWRFDDFAPAAESFYRQVERDFSVPIYHPLPEIRFCLNAEDAKRAGRRSRNPRYANVLGAYRSPTPGDHPFRDDHGSFRIMGAAYVDLPQYVATLRAHFAARNLYWDRAFLYSELHPSAGAWTYRGSSYDQVIFCEGTAMQKNPWFQHLPLTPAKGETLLCRSSSLELPQELYHHDKWILPYPDGSFRVGATYAEDDPSHEPTPEAADLLTRSFHNMTRQDHPLTIQQHLAGLRPATADARPLLGRHPEHPGLYLFNGLGSKGAALAPKLAEELLGFIFDDRPLDPEASIERF
jgi:glycine/D-amino acid oxidase-like deaminating enzyme